MKKILTLLSLLVVAVSTFGQEFTIGDLTYAVLSEEEKTAQVVNGQNATGDVVVPEVVTYEDVVYSVTEICGGAFYSNGSITSIVAPSIITINDHAFYSCSSLASFSFPNVVNIRYGAFQCCGAIEEAILPKVETIGEWVFVGPYSDEDYQFHSALKRVDLSSVKSIESYAFYRCSNINSLRIGSVDQWCQVNFGEYDANPLTQTSQAVTLYVGNSETPAKNLVASNALTEISNYAFFRISNIESFSAPAVTSIGDAAFASCTSLASIDLPEATNVGSSAFSGTALTSVNLPAATAIESYAFQGCESLEEAIMPKVETIGSYAFSRTALTSINLPVATTIESHAFQGCESLEEAIMPKVETIGYRAFGYTDNYDENGNWAPRYCKSLARVDLSSVKSIDNYAFQGCSNINSLRIGSVDQWCQVNFGEYEAHPLQQTSQAVSLYVGNSETPAKNLVASSSLTEIPNYAFYRVPNIESFSAPAATTIGGAAFASCTSLASIDIPAATNIGSSAFSGTALTTVNLPAATTIGSYAFSGSAITSVNLPVATAIESYAFQGCESLEEAIMPKVETIGYQAFGYTDYYDENGNYAQRYCKSLARVDLSSVKSIDNYAFQGCSNINSLRIGSVDQWCQVNFGEYEAHPLQQTSQAVSLYVGNSETPAKNLVASSSLTEIPKYAFYRVPNIESFSAPAATTIGGAAFASCTSLASIDIPAATTIGSNAFSGSAITSVNLPAATTIGSYAFAGCESLEEAILPKVETIDSYAFSSCISLTSANLPEATSIGEWAFSHCKSLEEAIMPKIETLGDAAFYSYYDNDEHRYISSLKRVDLSSVKKIGDMAFLCCNEMSHLELPKVKEIGREAFSSASALRYLSIPKVEKIGERSFSGPNIDTLRIGSVEQYCNIKYQVYEGMGEWDYQHTFPFGNVNNYNEKNFLFIGDSETPATEITIPESVGQVPDFAFLGTGIHTIHYEGTTPPSLVSTNSFSDWTMLAVPEEAYETYLAADVYNTIPLQITKDGHITQELEVEAKSTTSALLAKVGDREIRNVVNLKLKGTINSYDMLIIRNRMTSLRNLDLSEASIVDCDYVYSTSEGNSYHSMKDEITGDWLMGLMNVKLPASTKSIGYGAFRGCNRLVSVDIPDGVESIGGYAFYGCNRIKELTLPQSVTSVGEYAFYDCTGLREVVIPDGVTSINQYAFEGCRDLEKVTIPASVKNIGYDAFYDTPSISLRISDINSWMDAEIGEYWNNSGAFGSVGTLFIGDSDEPVEDIIIPAGTTELKRNTFAGFGCLKSITLPDELTTIGSGAFRNTGLIDVIMPKNLQNIGDFAFSGCTNLENVEFKDSLKNIGEYAFSGCYKLKRIELPAYLQTIGSYAFNSCSSLTEVLIPGSIREIGDYAFIGCSNLNTVIATTVEPITINQNTFSTYRTANVYSPKTSYWKYYWNTQWNQFLSVNEYGKKFGKHYGYKYFYLRGHHGGKKEDFEISDETGTVHGKEDEVTGIEKAPDADFGEESGIIVGGEQIQNLGDIHIHHNGNNGASVIAKNQGKVHIDNLYVDIKTQPNRWYTFCFPFDILPGEATFDGSYVWYLYDGEARAKNGNGGWKKVASDGVMKSGNGYIFQGAVNGTLSIHVKDITIDTSDNSTNMITYQSENKNDASWNLIGNSNFAYYDIDNLGYEAPITVYNNETGNYEAVRAGEDDYEFYPFQAFFVQKPEGTESVDFENSKKETKNKSDEKKARRAAERAKAPKHVDAMRKIINLELAEENMQNDSVAALTDRTRIVVNPTKSMAYEMDCDAAKFIAENMPQIYSLGNDGSMYAINERPEDNGIIKIAVKTVKNGVYTISASRLDREAKLRDLETGSVVDLSKGGYTFAADAATYTNRFQLILADEATAITAAEDDMAAISVEAGAIRINKANANVKIYTVGGSLVATQKGEGSISVPAGIYVVVVNGKSTKVTVKE